MFTGRETPVPGWRGGDGNAAYLDKTLRFTDIETRLNETVGAAQIFYLFARGLAVSVLVSGLGLFVGLPVLFVGVKTFTVWMTLVAIGSAAAFWLVVLFAREPEPIAEWRVLLAEREGRKEQAYRGIRRVLDARGFPLDVTEEDGRLVLRERGYAAYISVFTYGSSLYLGWMMWRSRRGHQLIGQFLGDMLQSLQGRNQIEHQILRSERARALREAVHIASREGLMIALEDARQEGVTFGKDATGGGPAAPGLPVPPPAAPLDAGPGAMPPPMPAVPQPAPPRREDGDGGEARGGAR